MKKFFIALFSLCLAGCSSTEDFVENSETQGTQKLSNSMSLAHKELLEIIDDQNYLLNTYTKEVTDKIEFAQMNTKYKKLVSRWENYITQHPKDINAIIIYGKFLRSVGEFANAYAAFREVDKIDPNIAVVKQQLATFEGDCALYKESLANIKKAIELDSQEYTYFYQLAELLCAYYNDFIQDNIYDTKALNEEIEKSFVAALDLAPYNEHLYWRYAQSFYQQSEANWEKALKAWENIEPLVYANLEKNNVLLNKARVLIELFRDDEAMQILEKIDSPTLQKSKDRLISIIEAQLEGDREAEEALRGQEQEIIETERKGEIKNPHQNNEILEEENE